MPLSAPKPVDALRQHTRAVVLVSADGGASPALLDAIRDSEIPSELISHPLVAMAELVRLEQDNRQQTERTALMVADDERIEQLSSLFQAVRSRLPQVAIWVIAGEFAVQVQRATPPGSSARDAVGTAARDRVPSRQPPQLRIVDPAYESDGGDPAEPAGDDAKDAHLEDPLVRQLRVHGARLAANAEPLVQPQAIEAIEVKPTDGQRGDGQRGESDHPRTASRDSAAGADTDAPIDSDSDSGSEPPHSTKLTAEELDMLLGWSDEDTEAPR